MRFRRSFMAQMSLHLNRIRRLHPSQMNHHRTHLSVVLRARMILVGLTGMGIGTGTVPTLRESTVVANVLVMMGPGAPGTRPVAVRASPVIVGTLFEVVELPI